MQNFFVIGWGHFKPEHYKCWLSFKFDRNIVSGTGWHHVPPELQPRDIIYKEQSTVLLLWFWFFYKIFVTENYCILIEISLNQHSISHNLKLFHNQYQSRWVTHSPLLIFEVHFVRFNQYSCTGEHFQLLGSILCLWNHSMCLCCFVLTCKLTWDFLLQQLLFYSAYPLDTGDVVIKISCQFAC